MAIVFDVESAIAQLELLGYALGEKVCLRFFYPSGDPRKDDDRGRKLDFVFPDFPIQEIEKLQNAGRGAYFVVNGGGHTDAEVSCGRAIFYEHDELETEDSQDYWRRIGLPEPTFQVNTGGKSIHSYWVLSTAISVEQWRKIQSDLIELAGADSQNRNPSRVFRLAGAFHLKPGREPVKTEICAKSGNVYEFDQLRSRIPEPSSKIRWKDFDRNFRLPYDARIPLEVCLSRQNRDILSNGARQGSRNGDGFALACDLIGLSSYLGSIGQRFDGDPRSLFEQFADRCSPSIESSEREQIWKSAEARSSSPVLPEDFITACAKHWIWKNLRESVRLPEQVSEPQNERVSETPVLRFHEILDRVDIIERSTIDENELAWNLQNFAHDEGLAKRGFNGKTLLQMARSRRDSGANLEVLDAHDILESEQNPKFLIAGHLLEGTVTVLGATGGTGKTSLLYSFAKHIALGKPWNGYRVRQGKSLIVQTDEPKPNIKQKLRIAEFKDIPRGMVDFVTQFRFTKFRQLAELIRRNKYSFVVIDSWTAAHAGMGIDLTKSNAGDNAYLLRDLAEETGAAIVVVHHLSKTGDLRDSSTLADNVSEVWKMSRGVSEDRLTPSQRVLSIEKSRSDLQGKYLLEQNPADYSWFHMGLFEAPDLKGEEPLITRVFYQMSRNPLKKYSAASVAKEFNADFGKAQADLDRLQRQGAIDCHWVVHEGKGFWSYVYRPDHSAESEFSEAIEPIVEEPKLTVEDAISELKITISLNDPGLKKYAIETLGKLSPADKKKVWRGLTQQERDDFNAIGDAL